MKTELRRDTKDLEAWVRLAMVPEIGCRRFHRLLRAFVTPEAVLGASAEGVARKTEGFSLEMAATVLKQAREANAPGEMEKAGALGVRLITFRDPDYPFNLLSCYDPPALLYVKGEMLPTDREAIAVVGTRDPTPYGVETARHLCAELVKAGFCLVSGLAKGIDTLAHQTALENQGRTLAAMGRGLAGIYPLENKELAREIAKGHGALMSQFPLEEPPQKRNFPMRNGLISGLARGVLVVEGQEDSGSLITADWALDQGREVFAVPGPMDSPMSQGPLKLIQQGAKLVRKIEDILEELRPSARTEKRPAVKRIPKEEVQGTMPSLKGEEALLLAVLKEAGALHLDALAAKAGLSSPQCASLATFLELKGVARQLPGKIFEAV